MNKTALRAIKAKALAIQIGIVPKEGTQWKWALRNLRSGSGELKSGRDLAKAKTKIGLLSNNAMQKIKGDQRKLNLGQETGLYSHKKDASTVHGLPGLTPPNFYRGGKSAKGEVGGMDVIRPHKAYP